MIAVPDVQLGAATGHARKLERHNSTHRDDMSTHWDDMDHTSRRWHVRSVEAAAIHEAPQERAISLQML